MEFLLDNAFEACKACYLFDISYLTNIEDSPHEIPKEKNDGTKLKIRQEQRRDSALVGLTQMDLFDRNLAV